MPSTPRHSPTVSVLVRSKNDRAFVRQTLQMLTHQEDVNLCEIICCDDHSSDGTADLEREFSSVTMLPPPDLPYRPGKTLNHLVRHASGDILVFNNADAIPQDSRYLAELIAPLVSQQAGAVYGNQLPRPDAHPLVQKDNLRAFGDGTVAASWDFFFSLASSAIPRQSLLETPFDEEIRYSEDVEWAHRTQVAIAYAPLARVEHSHNYTIKELKRRFYGEGYADAQIFGRRPTWLRSILSALAETARDFRFILTHHHSLGLCLQAPRRRLTQKLAYRRGTRDYHAGKLHA